MSESIYCNGIFVGERVFDRSIQLINDEEKKIIFTLCFTPTKDYPSVFGGGFYQSSSSSIIHGIYDGVTQETSFTEIINGISTYKYQCKLTTDKSNGSCYLHGTWKSLVNENLFGRLAMISESDQPSELISGIWIGESTPHEELKDFYLPINPIRWCGTLFRTNRDIWTFFGSGYFSDSADIPNQPLLFFSLDGNGTLDNMKITKKYITTDYIVEYQGNFLKNENDKYHYQGHWSNALASSYGSFTATQHRLNPLLSYKLDISLCEVCQSTIYPGENRWRCFQCHFSTCSGCNLNSIVTNHQHQLILDILPNQNTANGNTSRQLIENAFQLFDTFPLIIYRDISTNQLISLTYGQMSNECQLLGKYLKQYLQNANDDHRPMILLICDTSPAYICCLLTGLLLQSVIVPINGSLTIDAIQHTLSTINPSVIIIGEQYVEKVSPILSLNQKQNSIIIYQNEEQFQSNIINDNNDIISFTKALQLGEQLNITLTLESDLSLKTISAILSTSGSTGYPKGAIFTEELLIPNDNFTLISPFIRIDYQSFDPVLLLSLMSTIRYGSARGLTNLNLMWDDIKLIKPTSLGLTPSLWNMIYKKYLNQLNRNLTKLEKENIQKQMREDLGGRLRVGTTGGGSISSTILFFIRNKLNIDLVDMYGCRECGNISKNGIIYPGIDVKLLPVKDSDHFDGIKQGEICIHSPKIIQGYWGIENHSSFINIEGKIYYKTGDIGQLEGNTIKLLDRSGTMIKNSMSEWISPVKIENIIEQLSEVHLSFILGHQDYSYLIVIICPSESGLKFNEIDLLQKIRFHCVHCGLNGNEIPQRIFIEKTILWNQFNGLYKEKKCRYALANYYFEIKHNLYNQKLIDHENLNEANQLDKDFICILEQVLNRSLNNDLINEQNTFLEIGGNSLAVSLLCQIYSNKGIYLDSKTVDNQSLHHLQQLFFNPNHNYEQIIEEINWKEQSRLPKYFHQLLSIFKYTGIKQNIFLTGATGFLGPILLSEIFNTTDDNVIIYCLIRAKNNEDATQRLKQDLQKSQQINLIDSKRIICIAGDISKEYFGLTLDYYNQLIEEINIVYHNASCVHLERSYKALKQANVQGTLHTLKFALESNAKFIYTSSIAALSSNSQSKEDINGWIHLTSNEIDHKDGYGQTKVVVEQLLKEASDRGAFITIIRPGTISSHTQTGFTNLNDFINILLITQIQLLTIVENSNISLHFVPVDYCAKVIVALANHDQSKGKCFNLYGNDFNISRIYQILFEKFPQKKFNRIKQNQWKEFLLKNLSENSSAWVLKEKLSSMQFIHEDYQQKRKDVPIERTKQFLEEQCHIQWFQVTEQHFIKSIDYLIQQRIIS